MRKIYGDALVYYSLTIGTPCCVALRGDKVNDVFHSYICIRHRRLVYFTWSHPRTGRHVSLTEYLRSQPLISPNCSRVPRTLISMVSCKIILNIRKYGNGHHGSNGATTGEIGGPLSGLRFEHSNQTSNIDTDLGLH